MKSLLALLFLWPLAAQAAAPPPSPPPLAEAHGDLDGDGRLERVHLEADGSLRIDDSAGRELGRLALGAALKSTVAIVPVEERPVVMARVPLSKQRAAEAVLRLDPSGKLETIYAGTTGPVGDGERAERLRVDETGVVRYQTAPTVQRCDGADLLFPERWDFAGHRFRPVEGEVPEGKPLTASHSAPPDLLPEPLGLFHFTAASTSPDADRHADRLGAPRELEDGRADTFWVAGPAGGGRGAWVTARAPSEEHRLRALRITPGPGAPKLLAILSGRQIFQVALSGTQPLWVVLPPDSRPSGCVSLVVAEPHAQGADTSLAEVALFSDLDVVGGIDQLVDAVAAEKPGAAGAEQVLVGRGAEAARAIAARLEKSQAGRRRLLGTLAALKVPEAAAPLGKALETAGPNERPIVIEGLVKLGAAGATEALRVFRDASQAADARADAARILGAVGGEAAVTALIEGAGATDPSVQLATLQALETAGAGHTEPMVAALKTAGCDLRTGILARALGRVAKSAAADAVGEVWQRCSASADFPLKLRLVRAAGDAGLTVVLSEAVHDREPQIRQAAVESGARAVAEAALADPDPGVRRAALGALDPALVAPVEKALATDRWPMVRRAAAEALGVRCGESPKLALTTALGVDRVDEVRREALLALARCGPLPLALLSGVLGSHEQPVAVRELAAALVAKQGGPGAAQLLAESVDNVLSDPASDEQSASLAIACLRGLGRLKDGSQRVLEALGAASNEPLSPAVRAAAMDAVGRICPAGAGDVLHRGQKDPEAMVQRAAREALDKCRR